MKVLLTADPMLPVPPRLYGGIERIIATLVDALKRRGHQVGLLAHRSSLAEPTVRFGWPADGAGAVAHIAAVTRAVRDFRPEVLHSFSRLAYLTGVLFDTRLAKVMSFQRRPTPRTVRWANRLARGSLTFTGCSEFISAAGRKAGGKWHTVHNFVDVERYTFREEVPADAPLVFLSRIEAIKGAHLAIEACRRTRRRLIIAGNHSEKNDVEGRYWRETIKPQIDGKSVEYLGPVDDAQKDDLLGRAAALIVPVQWDEPFGIVFIESLACGTPVVSCSRGALPEIVDHGSTGFLAGDLDQLEQCVERVGQLSRRSSRAVAIERFSDRAVVPHYECLYKMLTNLPAGNGPAV